MDPATGWFTQQDSIGLAGGLDLHGYAGGDPINFDDPFGLCPWWISAFGGAQRCQNAGGRPCGTESYDRARPPTCCINAAVCTNRR